MIESMQRIAMAAMMALFVSALVHAQEFPSKPLRLLVPYSPGGSADVVGRVAAQQMAALLGQPFVVENRTGAGGIPGVQSLVSAPPDGYTLLVADAGHWAANPALYAKLPYNPQRDFVPVGMITTSSLFLVVHESVPAKNLQELVALAKASPGKLNYGSSGSGSVHHLTMEVFKNALGLDIVHVPYKGTGQSVPALLGGQVSMAIAALTSVASHVKQGKVRVVGANTKKRSPLAPDVPPMADAGVPDLDFPGELGLVAPAGTPSPVIDKLSAALAKAVQHPDAVARFTAIGVEPVGNTPTQLAETIRADIPKYARAVKISGAKVD